MLQVYNFFYLKQEKETRSQAGDTKVYMKDRVVVEKVCVREEAQQTTSGYQMQQGRQNRSNPFFPSSESYKGKGTNQAKEQ